MKLHVHTVKPWGSWYHCERDCAKTEPLRPLPKTTQAQVNGGERCHAGRDGECFWGDCPQERDNEPHNTGRCCPLDPQKEEDEC